MDERDLIQHYPRLYHMAAPGSWESILSKGLLCTRQLLELFEVPSADFERINSCHRPESVRISNSRHGIATIRDQKPMSDAGLRRCLQDGISPREWYERLNRMVFFWLSPERLARLLAARAYRDTPHEVLTLSTERLLELAGPRVLLSAINSGCTKPYPHSRGRTTFQSVRDYPFPVWRKKRGIKDAVVELAVPDGVTNVKAAVLRVDRQGAASPPVELWSAD